MKMPLNDQFLNIWLKTKYEEVMMKIGNEIITTQDMIVLLLASHIPKNKNSNKEIYMEAADSMSTLYGIIERAHGPKEAKKAVTAATSLVISDLQNESIDINSENLQLRLQKYVLDFIDASIKSSAK